jgi:ribosomal protein S27AE
MSGRHVDRSADMTDAVAEYTREWTLSFSADGDRVYADPCPECGAASGFDLIWELAESRVSIADAEATGGRAHLLADDSVRRLRSATCECCGARVFTADADGAPTATDTRGPQ